MINEELTLIRARKLNRRTQIILKLIVAVLFLVIVTSAGMRMDSESYGPDYSAKKQPPSWEYLFGTDYLGRDMFSRTVKGLSLSILTGMLATAVSSVIALSLGILSATMGRRVDSLVNWLIDLCMGIPHIVLIMLISFAMGRGIKGVVVGVALTHWPSLTRVIRAEVLQIRNSQYVLAAKKLGKSNWWIARKHMLPHVIPQYIVGLVLLFPHAILHEASITFLGYGIPLDIPAIGIILSESVKHLAVGMWWLVLFPGIALILVVIMFDAIGDNLKAIIDPYSAHQ